MAAAFGAATPVAPLSSHISRWDLDKTYLRTEFASMRDLVRTALEAPNEKRTNPGAATLLKEMLHAGVSVHILSGSPEQMRARLESKLRLDGITWDSFTLKPNLRNVLRLRFRAIKDQLGYKLPALCAARARLVPQVRVDGAPRRETLFGDDAEADAFVYSIYADILSGHVDAAMLAEVCVRGRLYEDVRAQLLADATELSGRVPRGEVVERILIHLEGQTPPEDFHVYGPRCVPFYNYLQAAFVCFEDHRIAADAVLRVGAELVMEHRFDGEALARSYAELGKRGHLRGTRLAELTAALPVVRAEIEGTTVASELDRMVGRVDALGAKAAASYRGDDQPLPDYVSLVAGHNPRKRSRRA